MCWETNNLILITNYRISSLWIAITYIATTSSEEVLKFLYKIEAKIKSDSANKRATNKCLQALKILTIKTRKSTRAASIGKALFIHTKEKILYQAQTTLNMHTTIVSIYIKMITLKNNIMILQTKLHLTMKTHSSTHSLQK